MTADANPAVIRPMEPTPQAAGLLGSMLSGCILGVSTMVVLMGIAAMAFPGPLAGHIGFGIGILLAGSAIAAIVGIAVIGVPGTLVYSQEAPATILGIGGAALFAGLPPDLPADLRFGAVVAAYGCITGLTGLAFLLLGSFRLGELIRYVPFPVVGGMLAGLGVLIVGGAMSLLTGLSLSVDGPGAFLSLDVLIHWAPAFVFALALFHVTARWTNALVVPGALVAATAAFYAAAWGAGADRDTLEMGHWLLGPFPHGHLMRWPDYGAFAHLDLAMVLRLLPTAGAVVLISTFGLLLHAGSLELAMRRDFDLDSELRARGIGNIAVGLIGGVPTYHAVSTTLLARRMGAGNRVTMTTLVAVWLIVLSCGADYLGLVPRMVVGGLLLFLGLDLLREWLVRGWRALPRGDWMVLFLIVLVTVAIGYAEGIAFGLAAGIVLFLLGYIRLPAVKHVLSGNARHSSVERAQPALEALRRDGGAIQIMELQGFLFFGTANNVVRRVRRRLDDRDSPPVRWLILDLHAVSGLDWAAVGSFRKLLQIAEDAGFELALAGGAPGVRRMLEKGGILDLARHFDTLDHALEWSEDRLLTDRGVASTEDAGPDSLPLWLLREIPDPAVQARLRPYLTPVEVPAGTMLLRQGDPSDAMYFIRSGRASVYVHRPDGSRLRVKTYLAGSIVGEIGLYVGRPRTATVVAETSVAAWRLDEAAFARMGREDVPLAMLLHRIVVRLLGTRLTDTNRMLAAYAN